MTKFAAEVEQTFSCAPRDLSAFLDLLLGREPGLSLLSVRGRIYPLLDLDWSTTIHLYRVSPDGIDRARLKLRLSGGAAECRSDNKRVEGNNKLERKGAWVGGQNAVELARDFGEIESAFVKYQLVLRYRLFGDRAGFKIAVDRMRAVDVADVSRVGPEFCHVEFEGAGVEDGDLVLGDATIDRDLRRHLTPLTSRESKWRLASQGMPSGRLVKAGSKEELAGLVRDLTSAAFPPTAPLGQAPRSRGAEAKAMSSALASARSSVP